MNDSKTIEEYREENFILRELYFMVSEKYPELKLRNIDEAISLTKKLNKKLNSH